MGIKWSGRLTVDFEMEEGVAADLAERRLGESAIEFQRLIEIGHGNGSTLPGGNCIVQKMDSHA
jgi:hypothetical protein